MTVSKDTNPKKYILGFTPLERTSNKMAFTNKVFKNHNPISPCSHNVRRTSLMGFTPLEIKKIMPDDKSVGGKNKTYIGNNINLRSPKGDLSLTGFTLIEIFIAIAILGIIITAGVKFFNDIYTLWLKNSDRIEVQQNARIAMDEMSKYIRQASSPTITLGDGTDSVLIDRYDGTEPVSSLIRFHLIDWTTIQYYQKDGELYRSRANPGETAVETEITDNLSQLYFAKENAQGATDDYSIHIATLTLQKDNQNVTLRGYIHLKNP